MKVFFTSLLNAKNVALSLFFCLPMLATAQTVVFTQDFSSSTSVTPYVGTGANQFDFIGTVPMTGTSYPYVGAANKLFLQRVSGSSAWARTTPFSNTLTPTVLEVKFKLNVGFCSSNGSSNGLFYIGSGFTASEVTEAVSHSRFGVFFTGTNTWCVRQVVGTASNSPNYTSEQNISWYINNSGSSFNYADPAGGTTSLANDRADLWVGTSRVFSAIVPVTGGSTQDLKNIKLYSANNVNNSISVDDIVITALAGTVLPVSLTDFTGKKAGTTNQLTWTTESETNNKGYDVQRQNQAGEWETLGFVQGTGKAATYTFADKAPLSISYYRLRQIDFDGKETFSKIVSVSQDTKGRISITPNPTSDKININLNQNDGSNSETTLVLFDMTGRQVLTQRATSDNVQLDLSNLAKGMYVLTVQSNNAVYQEKIIRQ